LDTILTPELVQEGQAREFVRRVQDLRKQADFDIADRIRLYVQATPGLAQAIRLHQEYITGETLTRQLVFAAPPEGAPATSLELDGEQVTFGVEKYDG
jgi:isoleucyl-tRNA synthetase